MAQESSQKQIVSMTQFILNEAKDKAEEISTKSLEEFSIEKSRIVRERKGLIVLEYVKKSKQIDTQYAIAKSTATNKQRLEKITARQDRLGDIAASAKSNLVASMQQESSKKDFYTKLIVQGLLMLLEDEVNVQCRASDKKVVEAIIATASKQYSDFIQKESGASKGVKITIDSRVLSDKCMGGVTLSCQEGNITVDNTMDSRLDLVMEQDKPTIRSTLFGGR